MQPSSKSQIRLFYKFIARYFQDYGGWKAVRSSPFSLIAVATGLVSYKTWLSDDWTNTTLSVIPNLLGFSLGTYALLFSLISPNIKFALKNLKNSSNVSYLDEVNATFFHFIFCQVIAFMTAYLFQQTLFYDLSRFIAKMIPTPFDLFPLIKYSGALFGVIIFLYSILMVVASSLTVYRLARIVEKRP